MTTNVLLVGGVVAPEPTFRAATDLSAHAEVFLLARLVFGGVVALIAANNVADRRNLGEQVGAKGVPRPELAVVATSVPLLASGLAIAAGVFPTVGAAYLVAFMLAATAVVHDFWAVEDPEERENELFHFLKNVLIVGGTLLFLALAGGDWPYALAPGPVAF